MNRKLLMGLATGLFLVGTAGPAHGGMMIYYDQAAFNAAAGSSTREDFDTVKWDSWIYHTRLPSPIPALNLVDDASDPNDGPDYDLDGNFNVTGNSIAYAPADELFKVIRESSGNQFLSFSPWYNILWPKTFDAANQHPILTFDNFGNSNDSIRAFGLSFLDYTPTSTKWIVMELGNEYVPVNFTGPKDDYFVGFVSDSPFVQVQFHTNQNGGSVRMDALSYVPANATVPEPTSLAIFGIGALGAVAGGRRRKRQRTA